MRFSRIDWTNHLIELFTVFIGILMAFGLNSYNEGRKERIQSRQYFEGIRQEIIENQKEVAAKKQIRLQLLKDLQQNPDSVVLRIQPSQLKSIAWQIAQTQSFKNHLDYDAFSLLVEIYSVQESLQKINENASDLISYMNVVGPLHLLSVDENSTAFKEYWQVRKQSWIPIFEDMYYYENLLSELYVKFQEKDFK